MLEAGQAVLAQYPYRNGTEAEYPRPYLIVRITSTEADILSVSSIRGKERKVLFDSNCKIRVHFPPFLKPSFVQLDSLQTRPINDLLSKKLLAGGQKLNDEDLRNILQRLRKYRS